MKGEMLEMLLGLRPGDAAVEALVLAEEGTEEAPPPRSQASVQKVAPEPSAAAASAQMRACIV